jgi:hypothetical protein
VDILYFFVANIGDFNFCITILAVQIVIQG